MKKMLMKSVMAMKINRQLESGSISYYQCQRNIQRNGWRIESAESAEKAKMRNGENGESEAQRHQRSESGENESAVNVPSVKYEISVTSMA
jgi:hypothetical protein